VLKGKRALVQVAAGGPEVEYGPRGINGPIEQLLFPLTRGALFYPGMDVLPTHAVYGAAHFKTTEQLEAVKTAWRARVERLFDGAPIPFRSQNGGDYVDRQTLRDNIAPGRAGLSAHIAD
jgi:NAD(P)H dehydrogenase (quinone)